MESRKNINIEINDATVENVTDIISIQKKTWLATYPNEKLKITKEDVLSKDFDSPARVKRWQASITNPEIKILVAKDGDKIIGFALGQKTVKINNEVEAIYILPQYQGKGIGKTLFTKVIEWLGDEKEIKVVVASYNENAICFYERQGFIKNENSPHSSAGKLPSGKEIPEIEMIKKPVAINI